MKKLLIPFYVKEFRKTFASGIFWSLVLVCAAKGLFDWSETTKNIFDSFYQMVGSAYNSSNKFWTIAFSPVLFIAFMSGFLKAILFKKKYLGGWAIATIDFVIQRLLLVTIFGTITFIAYGAIISVEAASWGIVGVILRSVFYLVLLYLFSFASCLLDKEEFETLVEKYESVGIKLKSVITVLFIVSFSGVLLLFVSHG
ncbi:MAG: hypothetical protein JXR47_01080 [Thiotrichales bacterium]|nr:hypothetical protein [Thiotrichales bacterium]